MGEEPQSEGTPWAVVPVRLGRQPFPSLWDCSVQVLSALHLAHSPTLEKHSGLGAAFVTPTLPELLQRLLGHLGWRFVLSSAQGSGTWGPGAGTRQTLTKHSLTCGAGQEREDGWS